MNEVHGGSAFCEAKLELTLFEEKIEPLWLNS